MNFSEPLRASNGQVIWSEDGLLLASCSGPRLTIWDAASLDVLQVYTCMETIDKAQFSPDGDFILASVFKTGETSVFCVNQPDWTARIFEGAAGLTDIRWSPDSRHILSSAEFSVKLTVWSLANKSVYYVKNPKSSQAVTFSADGEYLAVAERRNCKDCVNILSTADWGLVRHWEVPTEDLAGIVWSPDRDSLVVWDSPLHYRLLVFSIDGRCELDYSAYEHQLGIRNVKWSPSGQLVSVGSYDNKIRVFSSLSWTLVQEVEHGTPMLECDPVTSRAVVYLEEEIPMDDLDSRLAMDLGGSVLNQSRYKTVNERPVYLDVVKPDPRKPSLKAGVGMQDWSGCGRYLAARNDDLLTGLWIWDIPNLLLAGLLIHHEAVRHFAWDPVSPRLAVVTGGSNIYFWTPVGSAVGRVPPVCRGEMGGVTEVRWNPRGKALALSSKEQTVLCRLSEEKKEEENSDLDTEPTRDSES